MVLVDEIVEACISVYKSLPKSGKPNKSEWTVISAMVGVFNEENVQVLSLGTGSKCLGVSSMSFKGDVLNDSHAEVLARRAFLKYLYLQIIKLNETNCSDVFYRRNSDLISVSIKDSVKFYFVTSMSPCGDASIIPKCNLDSEINLVSDGQRSENSFIIEPNHSLKRANSFDCLNVKKIKVENFKTVSENIESSNTLKNSDEVNLVDVHRTGAKCLPSSGIQDPHLPGVLYHSVKAVRTKPGRGDPTLSLSCSDKIARWNAVGWQGALLSIFIDKPISIDGIICGGNCTFSKESFNRAVNERVEREEFVPIYQSTRFFPDVKIEGKKPHPSSIIWWKTAEKGLEICVNGRKQGVTKKNINSKSSRSSVCKRELLTLFESVINTFKGNENFLQYVLDKSDAETLKNVTYEHFKSLAENYQRKWSLVKENCFKVWSNKPKDMLNFTLDE